MEKLAERVSHRSRATEIQVRSRGKESKQRLREHIKFYKASGCKEVDEKWRERDQAFEELPDTSGESSDQ